MLSGSCLLSGLISDHSLTTFWLKSHSGLQFSALCWPVCSHHKALAHAVPSDLPSDFSSSVLTLGQSSLISSTTLYPHIIGAHSTTHLSFVTLVTIVFLWSAQLLSHVQLFATPWTVAHQSPLSTEFSRQEYWSGLFLLQGIFLTQGSNPHLLCHPYWILYVWATGEAHCIFTFVYFFD